MDDGYWTPARSGSEKHPGQTIWLTGLSGAGKTTISNAMELEFERLGEATVILDGDVLRRGLSSDLGLGDADRSEQARRAAHVAALFSQAGLVAIVALISPYAADRLRAREIHEELELPFLEVWIDTPLEVCSERDPKGLYARQRAGQIHGLTGVDAPYEVPTSADVRVSGFGSAPREAALEIIGCALQLRGDDSPQTLKY